MAEGVFQKVSQLLARLGAKKPWEITGIASTPDYLDYLPKAGEYRKFAPGSQPVKAIIPHDVPQHIFDTKYFVRDYRRNSKYTARVVETKTPFDFSKLYADAPLKPEDVKYIPTPGLVQDRGY